MQDLRYPIGDFTYGRNYTPVETAAQIQEISALPSKLFNRVNGMTEVQLETPYRPGGWTVRQLIHHIFDSHANAYIRFKLALTEDNPTIKPYEEHLWAELADGKSAPVDWSLKGLQYLHLRWVMLLNSMGETELNLTYYHPGSQKQLTMREVIAMYAWHSEHHYEHINQLCVREGWA